MKSELKKPSKKISSGFDELEAIPGFKVMEWLRGVRDEHYRLSVEEPDKYKDMIERASRSLEERARKSGKEIITP